VCSSDLTQTNEIIGALNNPIPITYELPEGFVSSYDNLEDINATALSVLSEITGATYENLYSYEEKPTKKEIQTYFTHEIKIEQTPNIIVLEYNDYDDLGVTTGKTLYYDENGDSSVLNGYYAISGSTPYRTFYKTVNGVVVDVLTMDNSGSTGVTSTYTGGTYNIINDYLDHTSGWFLISTFYNELDLTLYNNRYDLITNWNTSNFYNSYYVTRGVINNLTTKDSFYLYDNNLTGTTKTEAIENFYRQIYPFDSEIFVYDREDTLTIKPVEVCNTGGPNGINYQILDSNGNEMNSLTGLTTTKLKKGVYFANLREVDQTTCYILQVYLSYVQYHFYQ
jgi:hypothetical protein